MLRDLFLELFIRNLFFLRRKSMPYNELLRVRPISSSPLRVRPYLMPCSPPHFSSSTPSSRVRPLIEWYPDELICDEGTSRMCQMSRQRRPFWISAIAILCAGSGNTRNNCITELVIKRTTLNRLSVHRFNSLIFFSRVEYSPHSSFSCCWKSIDHSNRVLKHWIYIFE